MTIDWKVAYLGILRALAQGYRLSGLGDRAEVIEKVIAGIESARNMDAHMALVATAVASDDPNDWDGLTARINEHGEEFQKPGGQS